MMAGEAILVVEDNPINLKLLVFILTSHGYKVRTARDAPEALSILETFHPRLILMDLQLPGMDGLDLARRLKADSRTARIVIVAVTAYAMKGDQERALDAGCDGYISKPIDIAALLGLVARHAGQGETAAASKR